MAKGKKRKKEIAPFIESYVVVRSSQPHMKETDQIALVFFRTLVEEKSAASLVV